MARQFAVASVVAVAALTLGGLVSPVVAADVRIGVNIGPPPVVVAPAAPVFVAPPPPVVVAPGVLDLMAPELRRRPGIAPRVHHCTSR